MFFFLSFSLERFKWSNWTQNYFWPKLIERMMLKLNGWCWNCVNHSYDKTSIVPYTWTELYMGFDWKEHQEQWKWALHISATTYNVKVFYVYILALSAKPLWQNALAQWFEKTLTLTNFLWLWRNRKWWIAGFKLYCFAFQYKKEGFLWLSVPLHITTKFILPWCLRLNFSIQQKFTIWN